MKSQSSLEVPKQVRSASFDEIQLEAQRQESSANAELRSIANIAMATSSGHDVTPAHGPGPGPPQRADTIGYGPGPRRSLNTLRIPQMQTGQRSKSFDVASTSGSAGTERNLLDQPASAPMLPNTASSYGYSRWRSSAERELPPAPAPYTCWHCQCVEELRAAKLRNQTDSWDDDDDDEERQYDDEDNDADAEYESGPGSTELFLGEPPQLERDASDNSYYYVVVRPTRDEPEEEGSDCSRREGSPEIRVTLTTTSEKTSTDLEVDSSELSDGRTELVPESRQRRRSLSRQEALELPTLLTLPCGLAAATGAGDESSPDEDEEEPHDEENERSASAENPTAGLVVRDIFLTVPDLKRDRAASVDSCFNNNKNGKIETCYSLQVPQQSPRSKSVDIVLPTEVQTRYTALLPEDPRIFG